MKRAVFFFRLELMVTLFLTGLLSFGLAIVSSAQLDLLKKSQVKSIYVAPPKYIDHLVFGYNQSAADSLWLRTIQDFDLCANSDSPEAKDSFVKKPKLPSGASDRKVKFLFEFVSKANKGRKTCHRGWVFRMIDSTTELDPRFRMAYIAGALGLSIMIDDYEGAAVIFDKAVERFPDDWSVLYKAAYHYLFDQKNLPRAAELLTQAGDAGAPSWVKSLAATIYTTQGQLGLALSNLESLKRGINDPKQKEYLDIRIRELKAEASRIKGASNNLGTKNSP